MVTITAQKAVLKQDNKYLVLLRTESEKAYPGLWDFPGGKLESGEDPRASVAREVLEETGLEISVGDVTFVFDSQLGTTPVHFVLYDAHITSGNIAHIAIGEEHSSYKLLTKEEILHLPNLMPYLLTYLDSIV
jgi:8-oxo-dGTP diphosphatase